MRVLVSNDDGKIFASCSLIYIHIACLFQDHQVTANHPSFYHSLNIWKVLVGMSSNVNEQKKKEKKKNHRIIDFY
jgi:broad specificity polyphosphatase/5'/3'-nucleotidase SurE